MNPDRYRKVMSILDEVLDCETGRREEVLSAACGGDAELRVEVEKVLAQNTAAGTFLNESPFEALPGLQEEAAAVGKRIGPYRVVEEIGRGGMGAVYRAVRDDEQYETQVAVKLIKRGMDTDAILRRFRQERQILANLSHPNVARMLDGGTTEDGLPYFVMEYVEGRPIDRYCDELKLTTSDRLRLFRTVCAAVSYAHRNLVVHRDLKPSNILVTVGGEVKLLDFGIAKLLHAQPDPAPTAATATELRAMTPEYASPEQVRGEPITTASDVYSLGVLLYELLTGHRPYHFKSRRAEEVARVISEVEPEKPSTAVNRTETDDGADADAGAAPVTPESISRTREGEPERLRRRLRGDLDNIILTALRKEPARRYATVEQFSEDIRRHLEGLTVAARKDTFNYRAQKFVRRNRVGVVAASLVALALVGGMAATLWQARVARAERARAERRFNEVRRLANFFMFEMYDEIDEGPVKAKELVVKQALEYLDSLSRESGGDVGLQREVATAYYRIAGIQGQGVLRHLNDTKGALESHRKALAIRESLAALAPGDPEVRYELASSYNATGELTAILLAKPSEALELHRKARALLEPLVAEHADRREFRKELASDYHALGLTLNNLKDASAADRNEALELYGKSVALYEALAAENPADFDNRRRLGSTYSDIAARLYLEGKLNESLEYHRKALSVSELLMAADADNLIYKREASVLYSNIGVTLLKLGDKAGSLEYARKAQAVYEQLVAADVNDANARKDLAIGHRNLGQALAASGDNQGASENFRKSVAIFEDLVAKNPDNSYNRRQLAISYLRLSGLLVGTGDLPDSINYAREAVGGCEKLTAADAKNLSVLRILAESYAQLGKSHALLAGKVGPGRQKQKEHWEGARSAYQKSLNIWQDLKASGTLSGSDVNKPEEMQGEIAKCDDALKQSQN